MRSSVGRLSLSGAIALAAILGVAVATLLSVAGWRFILDSSRDAATILEMLKVALAVTAGLGGVVALVVSVRRQRQGELEHAFSAGADRRDHARLQHDRFQAAAAMLGSESAATRMAGAYSIAVLADEWGEQRQMCIDLMCAYLRLPYDLDGDVAEINVRTTILDIIREHLTDGAPATWHGHVFNLRRARLVAGSLSGIRVGGSILVFAGAYFTADGLTMDGVAVDSGLLDFSGVAFEGGSLSLKGCQMEGGTMRFDGTDFVDGSLDLSNLHMSGGAVSFQRARLNGSISLREAVLVVSDRETGRTSRPGISFAHAQMESGLVDFTQARFQRRDLVPAGEIELVMGAGGTVPTVIEFDGMQLSGGAVEFPHAELRQVGISFRGAAVSRGVLRWKSVFMDSATVSFQNARISGGEIRWEGATLRYPESVSGDDGAPTWLRELEEASQDELLAPHGFSHRPRPTGYLELWDAEMTGGRLVLTGLDVEGGTMNFVGMRMTGGEIEFSRSYMRNCLVSFWRATIRQPARVSFVDARPEIIADRSALSSTGLELPEYATPFVVHALD